MFFGNVLISVNLLQKNELIGNVLEYKFIEILIQKKVKDFKTLKNYSLITSDILLHKT